MSNVEGGDSDGPSAEVILEKVFGQQKIERDVGIAILSRLIKDTKCDQKYKEYVVNKVQEEVASILEDLSGADLSSPAVPVSVENTSPVSPSSDKKLGCLAVCILLLGYNNGNEEGSSNSFALRIKSSVFHFVSDEDFRIRLMAGEQAKVISGCLKKDFKIMLRYCFFRRCVWINQRISWTDSFHRN